MLGSTDDCNESDDDERGEMTVESSPSALGHSYVPFNILLYINISWEVQSQKGIQPNEVIDLMKP